MRKNLTDRTLKSLKPAADGKPYEIMDTIVRQLGVRVMGTDADPVRTFVLVTRYPGSKSPARRKLDPYGKITLEQARHKARAWLELIRKGVDPRVDEERERQANLRKQENSFTAVAEQFIARHVSRARKAAVVERELRREFIDRWGNRPITDISQHDIVAVLDEAVERGAPYQAHNLLGHVRRLFNWAIGRGIYGLERSPCDRLKPKDVIGKKALRTRTLTDHEIRALWRASTKLGYPFGDAYRLLLLTGQRKSEVFEARWSEFDLTKKLWTIPAERMKGEEGESAPHIVPLTNDATTLLASLPRFKRGDYLFSTTFGVKPVSGFSKSKARLDRLMLRTWRALGRVVNADRRRKSFDDWVIHDIRRTVRTHLSALPVPELVRELVIAHTKRGLSRVYDQHTYLDEKRQALELWGRRLKAIVDPPPSNVADLSLRRHA
jgi:integrase